MHRDGAGPAALQITNGIIYTGQYVVSDTNNSIILIGNNNNKCPNNVEKGWIAAAAYPPLQSSRIALQDCYGDECTRPPRVLSRRTIRNALIPRCVTTDRHMCPSKMPLPVGDLDWTII